MGSLYRSELMSRCQLFIQVDCAFESVAELGELGVCQFIDSNAAISSFQRKYAGQVMRTNEMERKIHFIQSELESSEIVVPEPDEIPLAPLYKDINELETRLERLEEEILRIKTTLLALKSDYEKISDVRHVLLQMHVLFQEDQRSNALLSISEAEHGFGPIELTAAQASFLEVPASSTKARADSIMPIIPIPRPNELRFLAGIVPSHRVPAFERFLWRMCHGKVFLRTQDIEADPNSPFREEYKKSAFILFFSGDSLLLKVKRICAAFEAQIVENCPEASRERADLLKGILMRLMELNTVIGKTLEHQNGVLKSAAKMLKGWEIQVVKLKAIFHALNMFNLDITQKCLISECWIPQDEIPNVRQALKNATELSGSNIGSIVNRLEGKEMPDDPMPPPTFNRVNKFTRAFQGIVDAYGIADYREINPAPWTIVTFPFLFAVMFGDLGHGFIMFLAALALVCFERRIEAAKIRDEIFNTFYGGRYVILLMGIFAIYTGAIYNDIFSKSANVFGSRWKNIYNFSELASQLNETKLPELRTKLMELDTKLVELPPATAFQHELGPYIFGLDPVWNLAANKLSFVNPMKMKASVILGVTQMFFGLMLSLLNYLHFRSKVDIFFVFIPQFLFLSLIFVYLCVQIVLKWLFFWVNSDQVFGQDYPGAQCAPSLLVGLINMFMLKQRQQGFMKSKGVVYPQCHLQLWYPYQGIVEYAFMVIALLCIPVMLLVKPIYLWALARKEAQQKQTPATNSDANEGMNGQVQVAEDGHGKGKFNLGDAFVYQSIHTIEFSLGCISHTASYLRLWALSLAHAQLSEVLWTMVLSKAFGDFHIAVAPIVGYVIFFAFAILSVAILVLMEGLSAFLHALRLHWVEFQSKFYIGSGVPFEPFDFKIIIKKLEGFEM